MRIQSAYMYSGFVLCKTRIPSMVVNHPQEWVAGVAMDSGVTTVEQRVLPARSRTIS